MVDYVLSVLLVALLATFSILLLKKWGAVEWLQVHGSNLVSKMAHCDLCLSWWVSVALSISVAIVMGDVTMLLVPFFSTPLTRYLL